MGPRMSAYLDTCIIIYLIEVDKGLHLAAKGMIGRQSGYLFTSQLSRIECRVKPVRDGNAALLEDYNRFFSGGLGLVPIETAIIDRATDLRAKYKFKVPDAIHLATAIEMRASAFLTGDRDLGRCSEITVDVLSQAPVT